MRKAKAAVQGTIYKKRLIFLLVIFSLAAVALVLRVAWLQFADGEDLKKKAYQQQNSRRTISPDRGTIYDRNGKELAISVQVGTITCNPKDVKKNEKPVSEIADGLAAILEMNSSDVLNLITKDSQYAVIRKKVDLETEEKLKEWLKTEEVSGISIDDDAKRYYPNSSLASHVIGFTGADNQGLAGMESMMEKYLKGVPGKIISEVDAKGKALPLTTEERIEAQDGLNVVLTIDENIQYIAEKTLSEAISQYKVKQGGVCIVMDPRNGEILAMVSKPDYDLNQPFAAPAGIEGIDPATWDGTSNDAVKILNKTVWRNKAISDTYEPGSTFKTFTAAAGLEEGVVTPDTVTNDSPVDVSGWTINCWRKGKPLHGTETFRQAVYNSCNPVFVKVAQGLGTARFYRYLRAFGFFDKTDIGLYGESTPVFQENPAEIDMATASFGQRFTITPIQLITGYTAIVNDGNLMKPRLVKELTDSDGSVVEKFEPEVVRSVISAKTSKTIKSILEGVVSAPGATGANAYVKGYRIAGKTGTAETTKKGVYTASFCGFAPANDPIISVLVVLFEPTGEQYMGGQIAAPTAGKIFEAVLDYMKVERNYTEDDLKNIKKEVYIPDVRKKTIADAAAALKSAGLGCRIEGEGVSTGLVVQQNPVQFTSVPKESVVTLYTYKPEQEVMATVPDLSEKTLSEAEEALKAVGLNIRVSGSGMVSGQSVAAGSKLAKGTVINVEFKQVDNIE